MIGLLGNFWFLIFGGGTLIAIVAIVMNAWQKMKQSSDETLIKREMLERGHSVEEIERLLRASPEGDRATLAAQSAKDPIQELTVTLGTAGASAEVIEEVLKAFQSADPGTQRAVGKAIASLVESLEEQGETPNEGQILAVVRGIVSAPPAEREAPLSDSVSFAPRNRI